MKNKWDMDLTEDMKDYLSSGKAKLDGRLEADNEPDYNINDYVDEFEKWMDLTEGKEYVSIKDCKLLPDTQNKIQEFIDSVDAEDWFVVSAVSNADVTEELGSFKVDDDTFIIAKATAHKCPRCWKFQAESEDLLFLVCIIRKTPLIFI